MKYSIHNLICCIIVEKLNMFRLIHIHISIVYQRHFLLLKSLTVFLHLLAIKMYFYNNLNETYKNKNTICYPNYVVFLIYIMKIIYAELPME